MQRRNFIQAGLAVIAGLLSGRSVQAKPEPIRAELEFLNPVENSYFVFDDELNGNFLDEGHSEGSALNEAESIIPDHCDDGWDESVKNIRVGIVTHESRKINERPATEEELEWHPEWEYYCEYEMQETEEYKALKHMIQEHAIMKRMLADHGLTIPDVSAVEGE